MEKNYTVRVTLLLTALFLFASCTPGRAQNAPSGSSEERLPLLRERVSIRDFSLPATTGETISLSELKGDVVFLYFWATW